MNVDLPSFRLRVVHLTALWAYGVSQPVFSLLEGNPEVLVLRGSTRVEVTSFVVLLAFGPPLLVVVADHGASFRPGVSRRDVSHENFADIAKVPLFVKYPRQERGAVDFRAARTVDILPTIADVLGLRLPSRVDGRSLMGTPPERTGAVVIKTDGTVVRRSLAVMKRQTEATIRRNAAFFGEGHDSLYRIGVNRELLGSDVGRSWTRSRTVRVFIEGDEQLVDVDKSSSFLPTRISGVVDQGEIDAGVEIAVAVNGQVQALTRCFRDGEKQRFRALVPESALKEGLNRVEVFAVKKDGPKLRLVWLGGAPDR